MGERKSEIEKMAKQIMKVFRGYGVRIEIIRVDEDCNKNNYKFYLKILKGTKIKNIYKYSDDVRITMGLEMIYPYEEGGSLYLAVSKGNTLNDSNRLTRLLKNLCPENIKMQLPIVIGCDIMNGKYIEDLAELVHMLVIGASGTGKSMALECMVLSIITSCPVEQARLVLFDIGANSLSPFEDIMHLYYPVVKDTETGVHVLESLVAEMDKRIELQKEECNKNPYLICIIDEFDDMVASMEKRKSQRCVDAINSIIRRGRKAKVILVLATHTPTVKITGIAINGIMSRIVFKCANGRESYTAIGESGAEHLAGKGTLLLKTKDRSTAVMLRGSFVTDEEIEQIVGKLQKTSENLDMLKVINSDVPSVCENMNTPKEHKELAEIILWVLKHKKVSVHQLQMTYHKENEKCKQIMDTLEQFGIVSPQFAKQPRKVLLHSVEDLSDELLDFLTSWGFSKDNISQTIDSREGNAKEMF